jgi:ADP-ribose pyrophosphatase
MKKTVPSDAVLIPEHASRVFEGIIFNVYQWQQKRFDGSLSIWEMLKRPDTTQAICIVDDMILTLDEEQPHSGQKLSFPGGRADMDVTVLGAIQREVLEETGYAFKSWRLLSVRQPHVKIEWFVHTFLAWDIERRIAPHTEPGEKITIQPLAFNEVRKLTRQGTGHLGAGREIFERAASLGELLSLPAFEGREVDR